MTPEMLTFVREQAEPYLKLEQLAARLGFSSHEWLEMEAGTRDIPNPDELWDRATDLVIGLCT
jgi:hypothetical protein